jgi:hypothetical protein
LKEFLRKGGIVIAAKRLCCMRMVYTHRDSCACASYSLLFSRCLADDAAIEATGAAFRGEKLFLPLGLLRILSANRFPSRYCIRFRDESDGRDLHESEKTFVRAHGNARLRSLNSDEITTGNAIYGAHD